MKDSIKAWVKILIVLMIITGTSSCERSDGTVKSQDEYSTEPSLEEPSLPKQLEKEPLLITYHLDSLENTTQVDSFMTKYSEKEQEFIFAINRVDAYRLDAGDKLVVPDTLTSNFMDYSPFPGRFEMLDSIPKTVLISRRIQAFGLYENGRLIKWGPVSSGKESTPTPAGLFYGNYKAKRKVSTVNDDWILPYYFNFANYEGVGVHQYSMPGYPASHACVRLREADAVEIYNWADQWKLNDTGRVIRKNGTPFMVFGDYDFKLPAPWLQLAERPNSNNLNAEEMQTLREYVTQYKKDERNFDLPILAGEENPAASGDLPEVL